MYDVIIIGAGPAGLTSALYGLRANLKVLVLEANMYGGQIINSSRIDNYPAIESITGFEFATNLYNQVIKLGCIYQNERVIKIDKELKVYTKDNTYKAKSIIIATGLTNKTLEIENEKKLIGKGISFCATCDGNFYKDKVVAVVGGGNTALEDSLYLSNIAKKVYLIHYKDTFKAYDSYILEVKNKDNIKILLNSKIDKINGCDKLENISINNKKIKVDGLFICVGKKPDNDIFKGLIELDDKGFIKSKDGVHTNIPNIYVAGDTRVKNLRQLTTAISDGAIAIDTILKEIKK